MSEEPVDPHAHRYRGKPFLELVDSYVLDAIGHLAPARERSLVEREAYFRTIFGETGSWRQMTEKRMRFPAGMAGAIAEVWTKGREQFRAQTGAEPDPVEFTHHFVDTKFPH